MPYGVASAPAIFQQAMEEILCGIEGVAVYLDDIVVTAAGDEEHLRRLDAVLQRLQEFGLRVKKEKCAFLQDRIMYLGHIVDRDGIRTSPEKVEAIQKMPAPENLKELQSFLGMVGYYGKFIPSMATLSEPLNELRRTGVKWYWGKEQQEAFSQIKRMLVSNELLVHYDPEKPLFLATDASDYGVGAVLFHKDAESGKMGVIGYASRTLNPAERKYAQIEKEGRAVIFGVEKFNQYLYGRKFMLQTDHEPLKRIFGPKGQLPVVAARRLHRWSLILMNYEFDIEYCPTNSFGYADGLSRLPSPEIDQICKDSREVKAIQEEAQNSLPITVEDIAKEIRKDVVLKRVKSFLESGWPANKEVENAIRPFFLAREELEMQNECLMLGTRTVIPSKFRGEILQLIHETHPGIVRMKALARQKVWWPGIDKDIEAIRKKCKTCQVNAPEMRKVPLHPWEVPERPWQRLHIDFCGPFLNKMWLIVVDAKTKWPEVVMMKNTTTESTMAAIRNLFWTHGLPEQIVSDNGPQFTAAEFGKFCAERGIIHTRTAPYHPQSNGEAERFVQTFKKGMSLIKKETNWENELAKNQFLLKYRVTPHTGTGRAPAEMMFSRELRTKLDLVRPVVEPKKGGGVVVRCSQKYQDRSKRNFDRGTWKRSFEVGQRVFARNYRDGPKWMKGQIVRQSSSALFLVRTSRGIWNRHLDQLKADETASDDEGSEDSESNASDPDGKEAGREQEVVPTRDIRADSPEHPPEKAPPELRRTQRERKQRTIFDPSG
uniref:RNA-directed DNA polymerase n=1 Tax=Globodera pallida TaxID=36090 RepID=A0A183BQV4_GLOPA